MSSPPAPDAPDSLDRLVTEFVTASDLLGKLRVVRDHPELLSADAGQLLRLRAARMRSADVLRDDFLAVRGAVGLIKASAELLEGIRRSGQPMRSWRSLLPRRRLPDSGAAHRCYAEALLNEGLLEETLAEAKIAVRLAREEGNPCAEGQAELLICHAYQGIGDADEWLRLVPFHAERAESAFRKLSGDQLLLAEALVFQLVAAMPDGQFVMENAVRKLSRLDRRAGRWWRTFVTGITTADERAAVRFLTWCRDSVRRLPAPIRAHWAQECQVQLAILGEETAWPATPQRPESWAVTAQRLGLLGDRADPDRVLDALDHVEELRVTLRSQSKQRQLSAFLDQAYLVAARHAESREDHAASADLIERNTSRGLLSQLAMNRLWARAPEDVGLSRSDGELVQALAPHVRSAPGEIAESQLNRLLTRQRAIDHMLEEQLVAAVPPPHEQFAPTSTGAIREVLGDHEAVLMFSPTGMVLGLTSEELAPIGRFDVEETDRLAARLHRLASDPASATGPGSEFAESVDALLSHWDTQVRDALRDKRRIIVVPSGKMWDAPLFLLGDRLAGPGQAVGYVPSLTIAHRLLLRERDTETVCDRIRFVGLADPDGTLPWGRTEVHQAARHFPDGLVFDPDTDPETALQQMAEADVVHIACHGRVLKDFPEYSHLHIAGEDSGLRLLWCSEIVRHAFRTRLLVLAACHAGSTSSLRGNEYIGFPGAFLAAGAFCVLAPLWAVDDYSTHVLLNEFYRVLSEDLSSPADALRTAQAALRNDPELAHPFHWAAFRVYGLPCTRSTNLNGDAPSSVDPHASVPWPTARDIEPPAIVETAHSVEFHLIELGSDLEEVYWIFGELSKRTGLSQQAFALLHRKVHRIYQDLQSFGLPRRHIRRFEDVFASLRRMDDPTLDKEAYAKPLATMIKN